MRSISSWLTCRPGWARFWACCYVDITVRDGKLTVKAERSEKNETKDRSEFSYGSFTRSVTLPAGANEEDIKATYDKGILTVDVALPEQAAAAAAAAEKHITVQAAS